MTVTIYHNPNCGTSRNVLAVLDILPGPQRGELRKEDGAPVVDATGRLAGGSGEQKKK